MIPANVSACYVRSGNNSNKIFDFDFPIDKPEDLIVIKLNSETDERKTLVFNSDYSIKEFSNPLGSSITYPINSDNLLSDKEKLLLISSREIKQQYLFNSSDDFDMKTFEKALDYIVTLIKQLDYTVSRTIKLPEGMDGVYADEFLSTFLNNLARAEVLAEAIKKGIEYTDKAEIWAEGTDDEVQKIGGVHSAKEWANQSSKGQIQTDWNETDKNSKSFILNKPKTVGEYITNCITSSPVINYSGSTVTVKSGLQGLSANGRRSDGSIINVKAETKTDLSVSYQPTDTGISILFLFSHDNGANWNLGYRHFETQWFEQEAQPTISEVTWYNPFTAKWKNSVNGVWGDCLVFKLAIVSLENGVIKAINPACVVELIKREDFKVLESKVNSYFTLEQNQISAITNNVATLQTLDTPNWNRGEIWTSGTRHTITRHGFILFRVDGEKIGATQWWINGNLVGSTNQWFYYYGDYTWKNSGMFRVKPGDTAQIIGGGLIQFFPCG